MLFVNSNRVHRVIARVVVLELKFVLFACPQPFHNCQKALFRLSVPRTNKLAIDKLATWQILGFNGWLFIVVVVKYVIYCDVEPMGQQLA